MKKKITIILALALFSSSAWATKARMGALGQDQERGSAYIEDGRNVFANPAYINGMGGSVVSEWGDANGEGGFFKKAGGFSYGVYFGGDVSGNAYVYGNGVFADDDPTVLTTGQYWVDVAQNNGANLLQPSAPLHFFLAGDMGFEWGARLSYSSTEDKNVLGSDKRSADAMALSAGVLVGDIEVALDLNLGEELKHGDNKWEGEGMNLNVRYPLGRGTLFAEYDTGEGKGSNVGRNDADINVDTKYEAATMKLGYGMTKDISSSARLYTDIQYVSTERGGKIGADKVKDSQTSVPLTVGFEADAFSFLQLRGAVSQALPFLNEGETTTGSDKSETSGAARAQIAAGATLNFGKLKVDGSLAAVNSGNLTLDNFLTQVAVYYSF